MVKDGHTHSQDTAMHTPIIELPRASGANAFAPAATFADLPVFGVFLDGTSEMIKVDATHALDVLCCLHPYEPATPVIPANTHWNADTARTWRGATPAPHPDDPDDDL